MTLEAVVPDADANWVLWEFMRPDKTLTEDAKPWLVYGADSVNTFRSQNLNDPRYIYFMLDQTEKEDPNSTSSIRSKEHLMIPKDASGNNKEGQRIKTKEQKAEAMKKLMYSCPFDTFLVGIEAHWQKGPLQDFIYRAFCQGFIDGLGRPILKGEEATCEWAHDKLNVEADNNHLSIRGSDWKFECPNGKFMSGFMTNLRDPFYEREFGFKCCEMKNVDNKKVKFLRYPVAEIKTNDNQEKSIDTSNTQKEYNCIADISSNTEGEGTGADYLSAVGYHTDGAIFNDGRLYNWKDILFTLTPVFFEGQNYLQKPVTRNLGTSATGDKKTISFQCPIGSMLMSVDGKSTGLNVDAITEQSSKSMLSHSFMCCEIGIQEDENSDYFYFRQADLVKEYIGEQGNRGCLHCEYTLCQNKETLLTDGQSPGVCTK